MESAAVFPLADAFKGSSGATHWLLQLTFSLQQQEGYTSLQRWEEEAAAKLTCYSSCHLHRRKMSALLIETCVFYKWHNRCCALMKTIQTVMLQKLFRQKRGCHVLNISHTHRHSNDFGNVWLCPKLSCLKHSLGFSFPDGGTIALSSSCHVQDDIFLSETPPITKRQCQALGMSPVHEVEMETTAFCYRDSSQELSHPKTFP